MNVRQRSNARQAFTLLELLSIVFVAGCLAYLAALVTIRPRGKANAPRIRCVNNLKNVGLAYRLYASDNNEQFPWAALPPIAPDPQRRRSALYYYASVRNELSTPQIFHCPSDSRKFTTNWSAFNREHVSYFLNLSSAPSTPETFLGGDRNLASDGVTFTRKRAKIPHDAKLSWTASQHKNQGNTAMADGAVFQLSNARLGEQWRAAQTNIPPKGSSILLFP